MSFLTLLCAPLLHAQPKTATWKLTHDTRIPLHDHGVIVGSTRIMAGTELDVVPAGRMSTGMNEIRLRYMNEVFAMPTGKNLQDLLAKQNPADTPPEKQVLDLHLLELEKHPAKPTAKQPSNTPAADSPPDFTTESISMELPAEQPADVPDAFAWDKTLIIPGKFAFLKLPFIKQTKPGICVAAACINAVRHLHPDIQLSGSELFQMYNNRQQGASFEEASFGNLQLGVKCRIMRISASTRQQLVEMIQKSLDANLPVIAADKRHAVLIYGYNKQTRKLFVWNQWGNGKIVDGMPKGTYLLQESDLAIEFIDLLFVNKVRFTPVESMKSSLESKVGEAEDLQAHPVTGRPFGGIDPYLPYSTPQRIKAFLRGGRTLLIPQGDEILCVAPDEVKSDAASLQCHCLPSGKIQQHTLQSLTQLLLPLHGEFYSVTHAAKLPQAEADRKAASTR